jgi:hypothetical protein
LPAHTAERLRELRSAGRSGVLSATLAALHADGWPLAALAAALGVSRQAIQVRVRQRIPAELRDRAADCPPPVYPRRRSPREGRLRPHLTIKIDGGLRTAAHKAAAGDGRSLSQVIESILDRYLTSLASLLLALSLALLLALSLALLLALSLAGAALAVGGDVLAVAAVTGVTVAAGLVLRQVREHRRAAGRLAVSQPGSLAEPDQVRDREGGLRGEPVVNRRVLVAEVQMPAPAVVVEKERPGAGVIQQVVDQSRKRAWLGFGIPKPAQPGLKGIDRVQVSAGNCPMRHDLMTVEEVLEGADVGQARINQVSGQEQGGRCVMSEEHIDS